MVICLEWGSNDLHVVQLMSLPPRHLLLHSWATVCKTIRPMLLDRCLSCLSVCD